MTSEQFAYWLQGFVELNQTMEAPSPEQWKGIAEHLQTVFVKVTPSIGKPADLPAPKIDTIEEALRRHRETGEAHKTYPFPSSFPFWGNPPLVTC